MAAPESTIVPDNLLVYGIRIQSRYSDAREILCMLQFCMQCKEHDLHRFVIGAFFDGKCGLCTIDTTIGVPRNAQRVLASVALSTIGCVNIFDEVIYPDDDEHIAEQN